MRRRNHGAHFRAILHDEKRYTDPYKFDPSRFLTPDGAVDPSTPDPTEAWGYGRRICPGRYFAEDVLWLTIANILAAFKIEKSIDEHGCVVEPREDFTSGLFRYGCYHTMRISLTENPGSVPVSVDASFKLRSEKVEKLIHESDMSAKY